MYSEYYWLIDCYNAEIRRITALYELSKNDKCLEYIANIKSCVKAIEEKMKKVQDDINNIPDELTRRIVYEKIINGCTFEMIANILCYSQRHIQRKFAESGYKKY